MLNQRAFHRRAQRGLSLVEMMIGIAIGLFVVAAATLTVSNQLVENRKLLVETQVQQDLRAAVDIMSRELRRAGAWDGAITGVWRPTAAPTKNPYTDLTDSPDLIEYEYRRGSGTDIQYGFKRENNTIKSVVVGSNGYQELTDPRVLKVTAMTITPVDTESTRLPCPKLCPDPLLPADDCWPSVSVREVTIDITAEAANDPSVQRSIRTTVRLRNDWVRFNDTANPTLMCPS